MTYDLEHILVARDQLLERGALSACDEWVQVVLTWRMSQAVADGDGWFTGGSWGDGFGWMGYWGGTWGIGYGNGSGYGYGSMIDGAGSGDGFVGRVVFDSSARKFSNGHGYVYHDGTGSGYGGARLWSL